jgi:antitoxin VapB
MLNIRDPRAQSLARELAERRKTTMTDAVVTALRNELARERERVPLEARLRQLAAGLAQAAGPRGRTVGKAEIDALWGQ